MGTHNENSENVRTGRGSVGILFFLMGIGNENVGTDWGSVGTLCCYHQVASSREQRTRTLRAWEQTKGALSLCHSFREQWTRAMRTWEHNQGASVLSSSSKQHKGREKGEGSDVFSGLSVVALGIALQRGSRRTRLRSSTHRLLPEQAFLLFSCFPPFSFDSHQVEKLVTARVLGC